MCRDADCLHAQHHVWVFRSLIRQKLCLQGKNMCDLADKPPQILFYFLQLGMNSYTAKTQYQKFKTNIPILRGYSPNSYIHVHVSVSDLYFPLIVLRFLLQENRWAQRGNI